MLLSFSQLDKEHENEKPHESHDRSFGGRICMSSYVRDGCDLTCSDDPMGGSHPVIIYV